MGLTPLAKNKSIVSDYRVKGKDFIAVIVHKFGHGLYGATHCSDKNCIMCDYQKHKGKPFKFSLCNNHIYMYSFPYLAGMWLQILIFISDLARTG